ncbi:MAG: hypothetical protein ACP5TX_05695 [Thermoplasmata archaeon]
MKVIRTEQIHIKGNETISEMCLKSKKLYNQVNYVIRQQYCSDEKLATYISLVRQFQMQSDNDYLNNYQNVQITLNKLINKIRYMGKRIKRGTFKSHIGTLIHANLNASSNKIKNAVSEAFADGIEGVGLYPRSLSIPEFTGLINSKDWC